MYSGKYAPWDHYPKTLRHDEVQNPFGVLIDFFSADFPKGHRKQLKRWRKYAIGKEHYDDKKFGPGNLVFTYKINLNLLEAMYLLLLEYEFAWKREKLPEEQLVNEKAAWRSFPKNLSKEELLDPFVAVKKIFKAFSLPEYRDHLDEWFQEALFIRHTNERMDPAEVIKVYDNLRRLYAAAWVIYQRNRKEPVPREKKAIQPTTAILPIATARPSNENMTWAEGLGLEKVVEVIVKEMPTVQLIVHIHSHREPFAYHLLLLVKSGEVLQEHEIANKIEDKLKPMAKVFIFAHKLSGLKKALQAKRRFFIDALTTKTVVYQAEDFVMPELPILTTEQVKAKAQLDFTKWNVQAQDFLRGARYYKEVKNYNLAAFSLHQAVESVFIGVIKAVLGYKINVHNLPRMLRISLMFTEEFNEVLQLDTEKGRHLFEVLRSAYTNARYVSNYEVDEDTINALDGLAVKLLKAGQSVYDKF
ncbi:HEPN domain-containing protein [Mucilaginibacter sp. ZT4R22]|uniref:HEPN domain-containing protein n=1 Tax=Mucilaginibacter pankratovii TaxID=2772110 RepID=A0ABR7WSS6_9SPHI|nr:HEPN domain-containing protein [Mucilaginibacter pankratovii]MBD1365364.1 HEPN domain-containing protein [Mucilaginibacter pankratovii]